MDIGDQLDKVFSSYIGRIVAFALAPLLALAAPPVVKAVNEVLGTDFSDAQLSQIAIATVVGLAAVAWQWLRNRGNWETKIAELEALYKAGEQQLAMAEAAGPVKIEADVNVEPEGGGDAPRPPLGMDPKRQ